MNEETNAFLNENLEEAHTTFKGIVLEMKQQNIPIDYIDLENNEKECYQEVLEIMNKMHYYVSLASDLEEDRREILDAEYKIYLKYVSLYVITLVFIRLFYEVFDTSKLNEMVKYMVGLFLGSTYVGLLNKDIKDNRSDTKDKRDLINRLKTMKEEYKSIHDEAVSKIDGMFNANSVLWGVLDHEKTKNKQKV